MAFFEPAGLGCEGKEPCEVRKRDIRRGCCVGTMEGACKNGLMSSNGGEGGASLFVYAEPDVGAESEAETL